MKWSAAPSTACAAPAASALPCLTRRWRKPNLQLFLTQSTPPHLSRAWVLGELQECCRAGNTSPLCMMPQCSAQRCSWGAPPGLAIHHWSSLNLQTKISPSNGRITYPARLYKSQIKDHSACTKHPHCTAGVTLVLLEMRWSQCICWYRWSTGTQWHRHAQGSRCTHGQPCTAPPKHTQAHQTHPPL